MSIAKDITGHKYGRFTVIARHGRDKYNRTTWECLCDCGKTKIHVASHITSGQIKSCGCANFGARKTHGMSRTRIFNLWQHMWQRCTNPKQINYADYGGRGIKVCDRWKSFDAFMIDMPPREGNKSLDRIDNNGDYTPTNCKWSTQKEQCRNKRNNVLYIVDGEMLTAVEIAENNNMKYQTLYSRLRSGMAIDIAIKKPVARKAYAKTIMANC
jgi:hypothetical protein